MFPDSLLPSPGNIANGLGQNPAEIISGLELTGVARGITGSEAIQRQAYDHGEEKWGDDGLASSRSAAREVVQP